jgi:hypothetical protein
MEPENPRKAVSSNEPNCNIKPNNQEATLTPSLRIGPEDSVTAVVLGLSRKKKRPRKNNG